MKDVPYLTVEIDEHSSDVGVITRLEAFHDTLTNSSHKPPAAKRAASVPRRLKDRKKTIYIPNMTDQSYAVAAAFVACGINATVLPESDEETLHWGRKLTSGRECYPCILTTGDMIKMTRRPEFDPDRSAFFMASGRGPCRFGQYVTAFTGWCWTKWGSPRSPSWRRTRMNASTANWET